MQDEIQTRIFNIDEEQLCYGRPNVIFPKKAKNLNDEWVWVVNIDNYTQSVEVIVFCRIMFIIFVGKNGESSTNFLQWEYFNKLSAIQFMLERIVYQTIIVCNV